MGAILTIATLLLALIVLAAGVEKLTTPIEKLRAKRPWTVDADPRFVRTLGALEVTGAIGLIGPTLTGIHPELVAVAAACLAILMVGAIGVEARRHRTVARLALPTVTLLLAGVVAVAGVGAFAL
jgi:Na+/H+ antiporter NhaD/arsenite permease-like protein